MKTSVIMSSPDRELFGITLRQDTKTQFFNLSDLQEAYNQGRVHEGWSQKRIDHILPQLENRERLYYILNETNSINVDFNTFMNNCESKGFYKYLKELGVYKTSGARHTKSTWANPFVWVLVALELHPQIYAKVIVWITDKLILNRIEAGNLYKELTREVSKFKDVDYSKLATALNFIVFNRHETGIRNTATAAELKELNLLEMSIAFSINRGFLTSFQDTISELRKLWEEKYLPNKKLTI